MQQGTTCEYDTEAGVTKQQAPVGQRFSPCEQMTSSRIVLHAFQYGSDKDATELLARLRMGQNVNELAGVIDQDKPVR